MSSVPRRNRPRRSRRRVRAGRPPDAGLGRPHNSSAYKPLALRAAAISARTSSSSTRRPPGSRPSWTRSSPQQETAQFGTGRYALFFKPGTYSGLNAQLGFYTSIAGLGLSPTTRRSTAMFTVDAGWFNGNATQNFWRSAENLALVPVSGTNRWAVAQAAPFRRMHVRAALNLSPNGYGWASGGYIADSRIDGQVQPYSQQQWYTRDSVIGSWLNGRLEHGLLRRPGRARAGLPEPGVHHSGDDAHLAREALSCT